MEFENERRPTEEQGEKGVLVPDTLPDTARVRASLHIDVHDPQEARIVWGGFKYFAGAELLRKYPSIAAAYDLEFEILRVTAGSFLYHVEIVLRLKVAVKEIKKELRKSGKLALVATAFHAPHDLNEFGHALQEWLEGTQSVLQEHHPIAAPTLQFDDPNRPAVFSSESIAKEDDLA
jgi:hypothetical protein